MQLCWKDSRRINEKKEHEFGDNPDNWIDKQKAEAKRNEISYETDVLLTQKSILNELEYVSKILEDINNGVRADKVITKDPW